MSIKGPEKDSVKIGSEKVEYEVWSCPLPVYHDDWHEAEALELQHIYTTSEGGDYWDSSAIFVKAALPEEVKEEIRKSYMW